MIDRLRRTTPRTRAVLLSLLMPGLGQIYLGRFGRALVWLVGVLAVGMVFARGETRDWVPAVFGIALGVFSAVDAAVVAPPAPQPPA